MVKSTSCFKIITCGSDSTDKDDLEHTESKGPSDKRGWSFRKRSARHRVLNTVITETPISGNKEGPESATRNFEAPADSTVPEKISVVHCNDEKPQLPTALNPKVSETEVNPKVYETEVDPKVSETEVDPKVSETEVDPKVSETEVDPKVSETEVTALNPKESDAEVTTLNPKVSETEVTALNPKESDAEVTTLNPKVSDIEVTAENETNAKLDESVVIVIQTAFRGFLARRALLEHKNVVKLQAAVRGHLVRRHAVGTLRCVQAIVKMQALVRARHARISLEGSCQISDGKKQEILANKSSGVSAGIEKLLSNKFARQLLESTPKTKPINVKCDPSKSDSAWKWLERWMSVSSVNAAESKKAESVTDQQKGEKKEYFESQLEETSVEPEVICESVDSKFSVQESVVRSESEDNLITYEADKFDFQACHSTTSSVRDNLEQPQPENTSTSDVKETSVEINSHGNEHMQSDVDSKLENYSLFVEPETEAEQPKRAMKRLASDELETEGKKFVYGSKKASNSSFIAAQSKFELSSVVNPSRAMSSSYQESEDESHKDAFSSEAHSEIRTKEVLMAESPVHGLRLQVGGSECGTELSVTSTLDSPDRSDIVTMEHEPEAKVSEEEICNPNNSAKNLDLEANDVPAIPESSLSHSITDQPEKLDVAYGDSVSSVVTVDSPQVELKPERNSSAFHREPDQHSRREPEQHSQTGVRAHVSSPEASPRSHMTVTESQGTPASQVSVKAKRNRSDKSKSDQKRESQSAVKKSPSNANHDSGSRSSVEKLPKDQKNGKRRNSIGSTRPDNHSDQEPRDSSSNSSLPHFMQATESARAKLNANSSPRSSPDMQDREIYVKKRHSLPGANGRQGSPRIQRSMSQAQPGAKANERKWQR